MNPSIWSKILLLVGVTFVSLWVYSQNDECLTRTTVITILGPRGKDTRPILSLTPSDLHVTTDGKDISVESVAHPSTPLRVSIVLDVGSRQTKSTRDATRSILHNFPSQFPEGTAFSLVVFDDKAEQKVPLQQGGRALEESLAALLPSKIKESTTGLYEALTLGIKAFGTPHPGDVEFLVTAWEGDGKSDLRAALAQGLSVAGVRLFGASFDYSRLPGIPPTGTFISMPSFTPIEDVASSSGGVWLMNTAVSGPTIDVVPKLAAAVMSDFYLVTLKLKQPVTKTQKLKIELLMKSSIQANPSAKDIKLSYPQTLYPCR